MPKNIQQMVACSTVVPHLVEHYFSKTDAERIMKEARRNRERANEMAVSLLLILSTGHAAVRHINRAF